MTDQDRLIEMIMDEFKGLARHPRPSHHEKAVSDYLVNRLHTLGVTDVIQDDVYNVIANVPATAGYEKAPLTLIQGHMDMVCVAKPGYPFNPLTSEIKLIREGNILHADHTSLGADDGAGVASALILLQLGVEHGPLRIIFTTDEETSMTGATHLDSRYIQDLDYIINVDSEELDVICMGSAGSCHTRFTRIINWGETADTMALHLRTHGFRGGHSGATIHQGKGNAIQAMAEALLDLRNTGIDYRLSGINGGDASNAIPADCDAIIVISPDNEGKVREVLHAWSEKFHRMFHGIEDQAELLIQPDEVPQRVFSASDTEMLVDLLCMLHSGIYVMNQTYANLPELSANIGTIQTTEEAVSFEYLPRSGEDDRLQELLQKLPLFAKLTGFAYEQGNAEPAWTVNTESKLAPIYEKAFEKITGRKPRTEAIHGGLETGRFYHLNPSADIISVGPNTHAIHSADESVELDSIAIMIQVIAETLKALK